LLKLSLEQLVAADHRTPDVDSGFPVLASLVQVVHSVDLVVVWADVVDQRQCFEPHSGVGKGRSFETENRSGDRGKAG